MTQFKTNKKTKQVYPVQKLYPHISRNLAQWNKDNPSASRERQIEWHKMMKRDHPEEYHEFQSRSGKAGFEAVMNNKPHIWQDVHFMSNEEMQVAKIILEQPIVGVNCHVNIGFKIIDFYLGDINLFIEYHPLPNFYDKETTPEEYYKDRRAIIDSSQYKDADLIVITSLKQAEMINYIKEEC